MKKIWLLGLLLLTWFAYTRRDRLYVRDPLAAVVRAGAPQTDVQVYVNYNNDLLLEDDHAPASLHLVEHGQPVSVPSRLRCLQGLVCLTSSYPELQRFVLPGAQVESMTARAVQFRDERGREVKVRLR